MPVRAERNTQEMPDWTQPVVMLHLQEAENGTRRLSVAEQNVLGQNDSKDDV